MEHLLAQKLINELAEFKVQVLICDDCSTDSTLSIIWETIESSNLNQDWEFIDCSNKVNLGQQLNLNRVMNMFRNGQADYVCVLEGDDYWISPFWLYEHILPLEHDPLASMSNNYIMFYFQDKQRFVVRDYPDSVSECPTFSTQDLAGENWAGNITSNLYRNSEIKKIKDDAFLQRGFDEWFLNLLMSFQGKVISVKKPLSVYRVHDQGVWNGRDARKASFDESSISQRIRYIHENYPNQFLRELALYSLHWANIPMIARLYFDVGDGYNEDSSLEIYPLFSGRHHYAINIPAQYIPTGTKNLRYDPEEGFECEIANLKACVIDSRGERIPIGIRAINGKQKRRSHTITFDNPDPQILLETKDLSPEMDRLIIEGDIAFNHMPFMDE